MATQKFVTTEECKSKIHIPKWALIVFFTFFVSLMTLFLTLVGYSASEANAAANNSSRSIDRIQDALEESESVARSLQIHLQVSIEKEKATLEKLEAIRLELSLQRKEQQIVYTKLLELGL